MYSAGKKALEAEQQLNQSVLRAQLLKIQLNEVESKKVVALIKAFEPLLSPQVKVQTSTVDTSSIEKKLDMLIEVLTANASLERQALNAIVAELNK